MYVLIFFFSGNYPEVIPSILSFFVYKGIFNLTCIWLVKEYLPITQLIYRQVKLYNFIGIGEVTIIVTPILNTSIEYDLFFTNEEVGDFSIHIHSSSTHRNVCNNVQVGIERKFIDSECICTNGRNPLCPKNVQVLFPSEDTDCSTSLQENLLMQFPDESDKEFWRTHFSKYFCYVVK